MRCDAKQTENLFVHFSLFVVVFHLHFLPKNNPHGLQYNAFQRNPTSSYEPYLVLASLSYTHRRSVVAFSTFSNICCCSDNLPPPSHTQ